jgi:hypothetical protein
MCRPRIRPSPTGGRRSCRYTIHVVDRRCVPPPHGEDNPVVTSWVSQPWIRPSSTWGGQPVATNHISDEELRRRKARQFWIYGNLEWYTCPPINNFIVIKNPWCQKARQLLLSPLRMGARILPRVHIKLASIIQARSPHIIIYDVHIFISYI